MTIDELIQRLNETNKKYSGDQEAAHCYADEILLAYINDVRVRKAFDAIEKWYA